MVDGEEDEDEEARAVNEAQLVNDMLQDQPDDLPIGQQEGFVDDGAIRVVDDEPLIENMTQDHQEGDAKNKSSWLEGENDAIISHYSPIHILGIS